MNILTLQIKKSEIRETQNLGQDTQLVGKGIRGDHKSV